MRDQNLLVGSPVSINLLGVVVISAMHLCLQGVGVKRKLDAVLLVEVHEVCDDFSFVVFDRLLAPHLEDHHSAAVVKLDLLAVALVVLSERVANGGLIQFVFATDLLKVLKHEGVLSDRRILHEVLEHALLVFITHIYKF